MSRKYKHAPIIEAVVDLRFELEEGAEWDMRIPGRLHSELADQYDGPSRQQKQISASLAQAGDVVVNFGVTEAIARVQLFNKAENRVVGVGPNTLMVSTLRPYDAWEDFKPRVEKALSAFYKVAGARPVTRVGVRYINKFAFDNAKTDAMRLMPFSLHADYPFGDKLQSYIGRYEHGFDDGITLIVMQGLVSAENTTRELIVDLDVIWAGEGLREHDEVIAMVDKLHGREGEAFEKLITDEARTLFDA